MTAAAVARTHVAFSPARIVAIASNTLLELVRLKVFYFMVIFALAVIGSSAFTVKFTFQQQFQVLKDVSLGAMGIFTWLLATLATAMLLPKDIEDRTLYTILAKPVPRLEYLLGKLAGVLLMLLVALSFMTVVFLAVLWWRESLAVNDTMRQFPAGPELQAALKDIRDATFNANLIPGILVIYAKAAVVAAVTLLLSTFATSWIFTIIISVVVYFIGHVQPIAREYWMAQSGVNPSPLLKAFLGFVALIFPDFQLFNLVDDIVVGTAVSAEMFAKTLGFACGYVVIYTLVGYLLFAEREL
jgi:ABC-type Na+ efflux pump permease subunit